MAKQFVVDNNEIINIDEGIYKVIGSEVKHIQVLRYNVGDSIKINNSIFEIIKMTRNEVFIQFIKKTDTKKRNIETTLYLAVLKNEMMDLAIKKSVELGIDRIVPFYSKNVVVKLDKNEEEKKIKKYEKTVVEAVKQCGRTTVPKVEVFNNFLNLGIDENDINFIAYEKETNSLKAVLSSIDRTNIHKIGIIIGPEGGFTKDEIESFKNNKCIKTISLGSRILRAETAAITMISIINYEFEEEKNEGNI